MKRVKVCHPPDDVYSLWRYRMGVYHYFRDYIKDKLSTINDPISDCMYDKLIELEVIDGHS